METVFARLAPLEAKLGALEATLAARDPGAALERFADRLEAARAAQEARGDAQAIAAQLIASRTAAEETQIFANRIGLLEAYLPRLSMAQSLEATRRPEDSASSDPQPVQSNSPRPARFSPEAAEDETEEQALWRLPRVVSVHKT